MSAVKKKQFQPDWIYRTEDGQPLYGVSRIQLAGGKKRYAEYHHVQLADNKGEWRPGRNGLAGVLYNLSFVIKGDPVFIVLGEKCADALRELGLNATTSSGGPGKWNPSFARYFKDKVVYVLPRNDAAGRDHAEKVFSSIMDKARMAKIVNLPGLPDGGDVVDWIAEKGKKANAGNLLLLCESQSEMDLFAMEAARHKRITDTGNAEQFAMRNQDRVRYCHSWGDWLLWDGARWKRDRSSMVESLAKETVDEIWDEVRKFEGDGYGRSLKKFARMSRNIGKRSSMLALAKSEQALSVTHEVFDTHKNLLNAQNGTIDLEEGTLLPHDADLYLTRLAPVVFDAKAKAPVWEKFIDRIFAGRPELISYVQKAAGYSLTGYTEQQCFFFCYGTGLNGKSTFVETLLRLMGEYGEKTSISTLMARENDGGDANPALVALQSARMVVSSEIEEGKRWNESLIKDLSGSDSISARTLFKTPITFIPEFKLWVYGNHKPAIRGTDKGIRRRIKLIPFVVTIPDAEKDEKLPEKLRAELPGILNWCIEGWKLARRDGMKAPAIVEAATESYFSEQDTLQAFIDDALTVMRIAGLDLPDPNFKLKNADLYRAYVTYNEERRQYPLSHRTFTQRMLEKGFEQKPEEFGRPWLGLSLKTGSGF